MSHILSHSTCNSQYKMKNITKEIHKSILAYNNLLSASHSGSYVCIALFIKFGQTKIRYLWVEIFV